MSDVSRETPPVPDSARGVFRAALPQAEAYAARLAGDGVTRGLIGPREVPRLWVRHLLNCAVLGEVIPDGCSVADVGSGAGLPGVVLAIARSDLRVTLIEPLLRRTTFLNEVVDELALSNVDIVRGRAEEYRGEPFDVVTSRAVAALPKLAGWCMPLVAEGGAMIAMKGSSAAEELAQAQADRRTWRWSRTQVLQLGADVLPEPTWAIRVEQQRKKQRR